MRKRTTKAHVWANAIFILSVLLIVSQSASAEFIVTTGRNTSMDNLTAASDALRILPGHESFIISSYELRHDFALSSPNKVIDICACSVFADKITLSNTGNVRDSYRIYSDKDYSKLTAGYAVLEPGEKTDIYNYVNPGCGELAEDMTITVESSAGFAKELTQSVNAGFCNNINATPVSTLINATPCTLSIARFQISNPLDFAEYYYFDTDVLREFATFSENPLYLLPGHKADVLIYYKPACKLYGEFKGTIDISTKNTELKAQLPLLVNISRKYDYSITADDVAESCNYVQTRIPITIKNEENFTNTYDIKLTKSKWFSLPNKSIEIGPLSEKTAYINSYPKWKTASPAVVQLDVISELGKAEKSRKIVINVTDCYKFRLSMISDSPICSDDKELFFLLENMGTKDNFTFSLDYTGKIIQPVTEEVNVSSGKNKTIPLLVNAGDKDKKYRFTVTVSIFGGKFTQELPVKLDVKSLKSCYKAKIDAPFLMKTNYSGKTSNITITNKGIKKATYNIALHAPGWVLLSSEGMGLLPGESGSTMIVAGPIKGERQGWYKAQISVTEATSNTTYTKSFRIILREKTLFQKISDLFKRKEENKTVAPLAQKESCEERYSSALCSSKYHILIEKDKEGVLNLSSYAHGLYAENITFEVIKEPAHIDYTVGNSTIRLIPEAGFEGFAEMQINATGFDASVPSPIFVLEVKEMKEPPGSWSEMLMLALIAVLAIIAALSISQAVYKKIRDKKNKKLVVKAKKRRKRAVSQGRT